MTDRGRAENEPGRLPRLFLFGAVWMRGGADCVATFVATFKEKSVSDRERNLLKVIRFLLEKMRRCKEKRKKPSVYLTSSLAES